ncbi:HYDROXYPROLINE-RICH GLYCOPROTEIN-LIKE [Salix koriyanagi]|uniref:HYDROXYPROLINE-RICH GLYCOPROTEIN-LIKE n=1 Tax=Salix koriyanagi TaxID=2511006 RepID=A0A9Q1AN38_9ROSI|nr:HYDROXYPROLINE-RICH GLYCOPROTEIN-LIKE [Salix koriyanagi]
MKSKLRGFRLRRSEPKEKIDLLPPAQLDDLAQAAEDMKDMKNCYDSLLSAAAATANSAYEFSESLREMGSCLLEKTALHDDEGSGRVLLMLGKVQFELQKLLDSYRSHIFLTITNPSESLLNELRTVEDMKRQCDEKRIVYEYMVAQQKDKGRSKSGKDESITLQQLQTAREEYDEEATLCVFRLKSLKQGQSRSLLTQAARHHAAQLNFFQKGLKSLETVEPHVRLVTDHQHIDYHFSGLENDGREDDEDDGEDGDDTNEGRELSFDYRENNQGDAVVSAVRDSMEVDEDDLSFQASAAENVELKSDENHGGFHFPSREPRGGSHSAPIVPERKPDPIERIRQMQPTSRKSNTYVLPTPIDAKVAISSRTSGSVPNMRQADISGHTYNLWHSSPLEQKKNEKDSGDYQLLDFTPLKARSGHKESNNPNASTQFPLPSVGGISYPQLDVYNASNNKKTKWQSFSGPITSKPLSMKPISSSGPISSTELSQQVSGMLSRGANPQPSSSPKVSPSSSPPLVSSPRISELHELPRPPGNLAAKAVKPLVPIGHSAPLSRNPELAGTSKISTGAANLASPLPPPPLIVPRSFSIPSSSQRALTVHDSKLLDSSKVSYKPGEVDSPPLTPISLANMRPAPAISEQVPHSGQIRGNEISCSLIF